MSDLSTALFNEAEAGPATQEFSDNPVCSGDGKTCGECGKIFSHPFYFSTHISIHASEKGYSMAGQCVHCGLTFSDPAIFQQHLVSSQVKLKAQNEKEEEDISSTDCLEYDNAEQDNERENAVGDRMPDVKPDISRELVTVKQEILDPQDVSHEPKAKRRRTAIQRYEPETHADPDNDPAVEAYLMSLTQMGLTVDPAAFGHPSGRSRGKKVAQGRGRSRGHRQPFGRGVLVLPRDISVPKKPSPKYEYLDYDTVLEDEGEILPKSGKQTRGERLQQRLQRLSQQKEPESQPPAAVSDSVSETKAEPLVETKTETKDEPIVKPGSPSTPKPRSNTEKVSKPGSSGLSSFVTPKLNRSFALDKNMIKAEMEDRDYSPHSRNQSKAKRGSRGFRGHQRGAFMPAQRPPPPPPPLQSTPAPSITIPGLTGYARANPNFRPPVVQTAVRPPVATKPNKHGAIASQLKMKTPNAPLPTKFVRMPPEKSSERTSKTTRVGQAKEAFPKFLKVTSPRGIERSKQESREYVEIMLQTLSDELIPNKMSKSFPTSTTFFGKSVDILTGTSERMPLGRSAFHGTTRPTRMSAPIRGSMFNDPYRGQVRHAGKPGLPDHSKGANLNFNNGARFPGSVPVRAPRSRGRAGTIVCTARGRGQTTPAFSRGGPLAQSLAYPVKIGRGVGKGEKIASRVSAQKPAQKPLICTDEVIVLEDDDDEGDSLANKVKSGSGQKSTSTEKQTVIIVDIDEIDQLKSKTEVIQVLAEKTLECTDLTLEQDKKLNLSASVCLKRIDTSTSGSKDTPHKDLNVEGKDKAASKKEGDELEEVEDIDGWKVCLAPNSDSESDTEECPTSKKDISDAGIKEEKSKPKSESPTPDQDKKYNSERDGKEKVTDSIEVKADGKTSNINDTLEDSISDPVPSSSSAVPLTFPHFIKDTDNLLDIFSEIEKTCKEIEENSGNEKDDSGTDSDIKERLPDTKLRAAGANLQEASKMDQSALEEMASGDCKVGNILKQLDDNQGKSSQESDTNETQLGHLNSSPGKVMVQTLLESAEAEDVDNNEKNASGVFGSDSCRERMNEKEPNDKVKDEKAPERRDQYRSKSDNVGTESGETKAMTDSAAVLKDANSDSDMKTSLPAEHQVEDCGEDDKWLEEPTDSNICPESDYKNLQPSNESCLGRKTFTDDQTDGHMTQPGDEAMETDDGDIAAPVPSDVEMDSSNPSETFPNVNTEAGPDEQAACERLKLPLSEMKEVNENSPNQVEEMDRSLQSTTPFLTSDKNNAHVKLANSKNVSGNGPGDDDIKKSQDILKTIETSPVDKFENNPDLKSASPSLCDIPLTAQHEDLKNSLSETYPESTELNQPDAADEAMPNVTEECVAEQGGVAEVETGSQETLKKRSPGRTSCKDRELSHSHFDGEDDSDRDGSDYHGGGANGNSSSPLNGVMCSNSGGDGSTANGGGGGKSQSVNVSDCDNYPTSGSAWVEKNYLKFIETQNGKYSFITAGLPLQASCKIWAKRTAPVLNKNACAIMNLCLCPSESMKMSPSLFKKVYRLQRSCIKSYKAGRKMCNRPPRALSKQYSRPQPFKHQIRLRSGLVPGTCCSERHPPSVIYNTGCWDTVGSLGGSDDDLRRNIGPNSKYNHKSRAMFHGQVESCPVPYSFESFNQDMLQTNIQCYKENFCVKVYNGNVSKIRYPLNVLPKLKISCKLMHLKSGGVARKLWLKKFLSHNITVQRGSQSGTRTRGQHERQGSSGQTGTGRNMGRYRRNNSNGRTGDRSGSSGDGGDDGNRDDGGQRFDSAKEENFIRCSICGIRFEFLEEWQKHMLKRHTGRSSLERQNLRMLQRFILPAREEKQQRFCAERTDSYDDCIESSHFNSNTYEKVTIGQTQVVVVKPTKPVVKLSSSWLPHSPGKTKRAARRPSLALSDSLKLIGSDNKTNDTGTSEVECNFHFDKEWNMGLQVSSKLRMKKHLTETIPKLVKEITESKVTEITSAKTFPHQCGVPVGGQDNVMTHSNISASHPPDKSSLNLLAQLAGTEAIKTEPSSPDLLAIAVTAEPELIGSVAVKIEPCSDHFCSLPVKEEPLSDMEDESLPITFDDSCLFKREPPEATVFSPPTDSSQQGGNSVQTADATCNNSKTIPIPKLNSRESLTNGRRGISNMDTASVICRSLKIDTQKGSESKTEIVFVYPNKPVINTLPRCHLDRNQSTARRKAVRPSKALCSKADDPQQASNKGDSCEQSTSAPQAEPKGRQALRIDTTSSLMESGCAHTQKNKPHANTPTLVYVHPKQPVINFSGRAPRSSPAHARPGPLGKATLVKYS